VYIGRRPMWWRGEILHWLATDAAKTRPTTRQGRPPTLPLDQGRPPEQLGTVTPSKPRPSVASPRGPPR
jgi:hypothetical protein